MSPCNYILENQIHQVCDEAITEETGVIQNIGYPKYYLGPGDCSHEITVEEGQTIQLSIVDLSIRGNLIVGVNVRQNFIR